MSQLTTFGSAALKVIESLAPTVATALGGPFAGTAVTALENSLGLAPGSGQPAIEKAILAGNPDDLAKVQIAETQLKATIASLGIQEEQLRYADVDSARRREIAVRDYTPEVLLYMSTALVGAAMYMLMTVQVPARNEPLVYSLVGALGVVWTTAVAYFVGSSKGSAEKTQAMIASAQDLASKVKT